MTLAARLEEWRRIRRHEAVNEAPSVVGGREAEILLEQLVRTHFRIKDAYLLAGRRIPSKREGRKREIDLIVCTPQRIHLFEVKNWAGQLSAQDGVWRQTRRGGKVLDHDNPVEKNRLKRDVVAAYLRDNGIRIDRQFVRERMDAKVVFMNPNLRVDSSVAEHPDVVFREQLDAYIRRHRREALAERLGSSLIEFCLNSETKLGERAAQATTGRIPSEQYDAIVACLARTGTWDRLHLYGTKIVAGDLMKLRVGKRTYRRGRLVEMTGGKPIRIKWTRGSLLGLLKVISGIGSLGTLHLGEHRLEVSSRDGVEFHEVGTKEAAQRPLTDIDEIVLG